MKLTAGRARLVRGVLEEIAELAGAPAGLVSRAREAIAFLRPRQKLRKVLPFQTTAERKEEKRLTRKELVDLVRPQVEKRAGSFCECGCGIAFGVGEYTPEWDEFYGRRPEDITVEKTWLLIRMHHRMKGQNNPSREAWDENFGAHCARHGYGFRRRFYRQPLQRQTR